MIVDADFLDHWRTLMLVDALGNDPLAPMYVIRIWANCQNRRSTRFDPMPAAGLKALCRFAGDAALLEKALVDAGFISRDGAAIEVPKWADHNAKLISNWKNGEKGGRPAKAEEEPKDNPNETQTEPTVTQAEPIREEKIREEIKDTPPEGVVATSDAGDAFLDSPDWSTCPHRKIIAIYHEVLPQCTRVRSWTPARATQLRARWNEDKSRQSLDYWRRFFEYVKTCDFLVGKTGKTPFFADLEWIVKASNFTKIREGKYENRD